MSTHAAIIQRNPTGGYRGIYVHSDGYPDYAGDILTRHYNDEQKIDELIDLGDLSVLHRTPDACIAYSRNYGEALRITAAEHLETVAARIAHHYAYIWEDGEWNSFTAHELRTELRERLAWEVEQAERAAGWDPNP